MKNGTVTLIIESKDKRSVVRVAHAETQVRQNFETWLGKGETLEGRTARKSLLAGKVAETRVWRNTWGRKGVDYCYRLFVWLSSFNETY